jgi:hypothetical protein
MRYFIGVHGAFAAGLLFLVANRGAFAEETLHYLGEMRSALTLGIWSGVAKATLTTRDVTGCPGGGDCRETEIWMTSEGVSPQLEAIYPLRWLYRTAYRPGEQNTLAYEELRKRRKADPGEYEWRHRVIWLAGGSDAATRYDFDEDGADIPGEVGAWMTTDRAGGLNLRLGNSREVPMTLPALDRWGTFQSLRQADLAQGASWTLAGAGPKGPLRFEVTVEGKENIEAAGRSRETWKVRIDERETGGSGKDPEPLHAWIAVEAPHAPVRFDMDHDIGRLRLTLTE